MAHDWINYPELTNAQMSELEFESPHQQIKEDFDATVVKVHDGDTITLRTNFRDFDFPLRFLDIDTKELNEGGKEAGDWLRSKILNSQVQILINKSNRVDKYGRLLGTVFFQGMDVGQEEIYLGFATQFGTRNEGKYPNPDKEFNIKKWL